MRTESWARTRACSSPRRRTASTWSRSRTCADSRGPSYRYTLTVRERRPDFKVTLSGADPAVGAGSAKEFKVSAQRIDGFEGPIRVDIAGVPPGFRVTTPLVIEAGQLEALGVIEAERWGEAAAGRRGQGEQGHGDGSPRRSRCHARGQQPGNDPACAAPKLRVTIGPAEGGPRPINASGQEPLEFAIEPGQTITLDGQDRAQRL